MIYEEAQIKEFAEERIQRLRSDDCETTIQLDSLKFHSYSKEIRDSCAMREADANSRLFQAIFDD